MSVCLCCGWEEGGGRGEVEEEGGGGELSCFTEYVQEIAIRCSLSVVHC